MLSVEEVVNKLKFWARSDPLEGMARYDMRPEKRVSVSVP